MGITWRHKVAQANAGRGKKREVAGMIEVLKRALEAFEAIPEEIEGWIPDKCTDAVIAIKQAIAELESQEPVACGTYQEVTDTMNALWAGTLEQVQIAEEMKNKKLYTAPPQRTWVGIEGEEIRNLWEEATKPDRSTMTMVTSFAKSIEAKLKEKNT
jgi:hypothetical protein